MVWSQPDKSFKDTNGVLAETRTMIEYDYDDFGRIIRTSFRGSEYTSAVDSDFDNITEYAYDLQGRLATVKVIERNDVVLSTPETTTYG